MSTTTTTTTTLALSSATSSWINRPLSNASFSSSLAFSSSNFINKNDRIKGSCGVAVKSNNSTSASLELDATDPSVSDSEAESKIGARVKVKVPLKVFHVPRVPELDLTGMEGVLKQYVAVWKGKKISANLPYKVEFFTHVEGRGQVKFFAHLKEDEFDYLD